MNYQVLASREGFSLLAVQLETGRPHQIRVQLSAMGHPIYGDQKYGQKTSKVGQQIALWAQSLSLEHPIKKEPIHVEAKLPSEYPWNIWEQTE